MVAPARDPLVPTHWFNILHDRPQYVTSAVSRSRLTGAAKPAGHSVHLQQPLSLARQSLNTTDRFIPIPDEVLDLYAQYRPTPLRRAMRLEERLGANARIYYKYEGANLTGSHKLNTALAQAYYYSRAGVKRIVTGTARGPVGDRSRLRVPGHEPWLHGLHGQVHLASEARPRRHDAALRRGRP